MSEIIESNQINLKYESYRIRNHSVERRVFLSIERGGINNPLHGIKSETKDDRFILLDGFKRYRCATKLGIEQLPANLISKNVVAGLLSMIRHNDSTALNALEQASFIDELHTQHGLNLGEIARRVDRSVAWVSVRISLISNMSDDIRKKIIKGDFPLRSYMYTLAPFTRVNKHQKDVEQFIAATSGHRFSTRDIQSLSAVFFNGNQAVKQQIINGNVDWTLSMLKKDAEPTQEVEPIEQIGKEIKSCRWRTSALLRLLGKHGELVSNQKIQDMLDLLVGNCIKIQALTKEVEHDIS